MDDHKRKADFKAFHALLDTDISGPSAKAGSGPDAKNTYLVVNFEAARNTDSEQGLDTIFNKHARNVLTEAPEIRKDQELTLSVSEALYRLYKSGTRPYMASVMLSANTIFLDLENMDALYSEFTLMPQSMPWQFTPQDEALLKRAIFIHENAHATLGLKEPGSDFMATAISLRENPESRAVLNTFADLRALSIQDKKNTVKYGIECYDAIHLALSLPPEQLAGMSDDEMLGLAAYFDDMNNMNNKEDFTSAEQKAGMSVTMKIRKYADEKNPSPDALQAALKEAKTTFPTGSEEYRIIDTMERSFNNLMEKHIAPQGSPAPDTPALSQPAPIS